MMSHDALPPADKLSTNSRAPGVTRRQPESLYRYPLSSTVCGHGEATSNYDMRYDIHLE